MLQIVKNYTGDVTNFRIAEKLLQSEGHDVAAVLVADDVASSHSTIGRRGTGAAVFVEKIAGACAERGDSLAQVRDLAQRASDGSASIGVALGPEDGTISERLLKSADLALYQSKADGRGRVRFFRPEMDAALLGRIKLERAIRILDQAARLPMIHWTYMNAWKTQMTTVA